MVPEGRSQSVPSDAVPQGVQTAATPEPQNAGAPSDRPAAFPRGVRLRSRTDTVLEEPFPGDSHEREDVSHAVAAAAAMAERAQTPGAGVSRETVHFAQRDFRGRRTPQGSTSLLSGGTSSFAEAQREHGESIGHEGARRVSFGTDGAQRRQQRRTAEGSSGRSLCTNNAGSSGSSGSVHVSSHEEISVGARGGSSEEEGSDTGSISEAPLGCLPLSSSIDASMVLIPLERTATLFRAAQKSLARDTSIVLAFIKKKLQQQLVAAETPQLQLARIDLVVEKAEKAAAAATQELERCSRRLKILAKEPDLLHAQMQMNFSIADFRPRINWTVLEYLSRNGFNHTAKEAASLMHLEDFWDRDVHAEVASVVSGLMNESTAEAFAWIEAHSAKLRKLHSVLETEVQIQNAIYILKHKSSREAVKYLKDKIKPGDLERSPDIRRVLALAAMLEYPPPEYEYLLGDGRKLELVALFLRTSAAVLGMSRVPLLAPLVFSGLCVVKSGSCPACLPELSKAVESLPMPHRMRSNVICSVTGEPMDEDNPPMASPDGYLISKKGLVQLTESGDVKKDDKDHNPHMSRKSVAHSTVDSEVEVQQNRCKVFGPQQVFYSIQQTFPLLLPQRLLPFLSFSNLLTPLLHQQRACLYTCEVIMGVALGSYIDQHGLEQLGKYRYVSAGSTPIDRLMQPFWDAVVSFIPMTLDAVDGKQARRTNTSTPLGQLFDHGCDSFSTVFAALSVLGTIRVGISVAAFMLIAILQMQLFIYTWWELHFHEYRCHTGVTGVTEGQLVMMGMNIVALVFGPEIFTTSLADVVPTSFL
ncbi:macrophage erythroblast attacher [Cyclospora cayetanensis]|uniref:Macrophage erythroblast attacher n=1 Tax=Cyclospora cayetanensis TaxID=88456 RepID=A0A1D3CWC2_9EIME|nr:macrophage erythroblast attacher [Cyclospora cayetanensis]